MSFAAGVGAPIPALAMAGHPVAGPVILVWGLALGVIGIGLACALRTRLIGAEGLPFPSGQATAEVIAAISHRGEDSRGTSASRDTRLRSLAAAALAAAAFTYLRDGRGLIPAGWSPGFAVCGFGAAALTLGISASPLLLSTGVLVGQRAALSMGAGALLAWGALAPQAIHAGAAAEASYSALVPVLLWPGLALMIGSALTSLALSWRTLLRSLGDLGSLLRARSGRSGKAGVGASLLLLALFALVPVFALGLAYFRLGVGVLLVLVPVALVLAAAAARAAGETDQAPIGQVGSLAQIGLGPQGLVASLAGGALVAGIATQTAQTLWAFKAGQRLGASPRSQVIAQLLGAAVGAIVVVPVYALIHAVHRFGSEQMPAPAALAWKATAEAAHGTWALGHPLVSVTTAAAAVLAVTFTVLERRHGRWLPSPTAMGAAFVLPASMSLAILVGALLFGRLARRAPGFADVHGPTLAAGGIAGESLMGLVLAAIAVLGGG
jgi:putative OPT family oligopeptide transporter